MYFRSTTQTIIIRSLLVGVSAADSVAITDLGQYGVHSSWLKISKWKNKVKWNKKLQNNIKEKKKQPNNLPNHLQKTHTVYYKQESIVHVSVPSLQLPKKVFFCIQINSHLKFFFSTEFIKNIFNINRKKRKKTKSRCAWE